MAKKFRFRLEAVLKLREYAVEQAKQSLAQVIKLKIDCEDQLVELADTLEGTFTLAYESNTVIYMQQLAQYRDNLKLEMSVIEKKIAQLTEVEIARQKVLAEKMKDQKIFEKLKEKEKENYKFEIEQEEQKFLDEIAVSRFQLKSGLVSKKLSLS